MNLLLVDDSDYTGDNKVVITDHRLVHINTVLKSDVGDTLSVGKLNGLIGKATILELNEKEATLDIALTDSPPPALPLTVILALPRPKMLRRIIRNIAELGIKELYLINSYKVEKSYWQTPHLSDESIKSFLMEGLEQSKDTVMPTVYFKKLFRPFIEDELPTIIDGKEAFVAHPYNASEMPAASSEQRVILIGPEGGFIDFEVNLIKEQGVEAVSMGPRIYKVENALTLLSHQLSFPG